MSDYYSLLETRSGTCTWWNNSFTMWVNDNKLVQTSNSLEEDDQKKVLCFSVFPHYGLFCDPSCHLLWYCSHDDCYCCYCWLTLMICFIGIRSFSGSSWVERSSDPGTLFVSFKTMRQSFFHTYHRVFEQANLSTKTKQNHVHFKVILMCVISPFFPTG